ncbi:bifunctional diaminohydroxyphosphoribosylaminopyrimidine deaminase/5-amino-6-(5-phosphoribosylamino)uracil reductase RibD [Pseudoalteromonas sp. MMG013]|uniref:bifunctional diaminohydroxyphosphoribosylaminopyrimidine deaminase/5-amino-6-(5-phosphoribosylamino)uracil reductase RibD n=1 Tax=Pseudoalteromonas sp. MMG013 TaxID=2822687 RepID=UPI0032B3E9DB
MFSEQDKSYMTRAIELAQQGQYTTTPNPNVGCVIVKNGRIVGEGFHQQAGESHAEVHALREAGTQARGATVYVTLEPCSHFGKTPPCAKGLIDAGVNKVIAAMVDPNPQVAGRGLAMLKQAGVETAFGLLEEQARALNDGFLKRMEFGLPFVSCKLAASVDGKTALSNGQSKWITSSAARRDVQIFRARSCAVLTGADTVLVDDAKMNVRESECDISLPEGKQLRQPTRVIFDSQNRLSPNLPLFKIDSPVIILRTSLDNSHDWPHFVEQVVVPDSKLKINCHAALALLAQRGINRVWLEAGATLAGVFHQQTLIDEFVIYLAPKIIGHDGRGLFNTQTIACMNDIATLNFTSVERIDEDVRLILRPS